MEAVIAGNIWHFQRQYSVNSNEFDWNSSKSDATDNLRLRTKPVETHRKNTYFSVILAKMEYIAKWLLSL